MPEKRSIALQPLSREHHFALLLVWKIEQGLKFNIELNRITKYVKWFSDKYLIPHFEEEEKIVFPLLEIKHSLVIQARNEHEKLMNLLKNEVLSSPQLIDFATLLKDHIRFEERILFNEIQDNANKNALENLKLNATNIVFQDNLSDEFWLKKNL